MVRERSSSGICASSSDKHSMYPGIPIDPSAAFTCVPLDLVLNASFVEDSDGGSLFIRLLAPPSHQSNPLLPFGKVKSAASEVAAVQRSFGPSTGSTTPKVRSERLLQHLEGPCQKLKLLKIEARASTDASSARQWVEELMARAYRDVRPYRRLKVLVNPVGGPGKARQLFQTRVRPILEASGCKLDVQVTARVNHGTDIAKELPLDQYDAVVLVSGDGLAHEVLNGFARRADAAQALRMPMCPIPTGSGNALSVNLLGAEHGFNLAFASLNAIKGRALPLDVCVVTQPKAVDRSRKNPSRKTPPAVAQREASMPSAEAPTAQTDASATLLATAPEKPYDQYYSFLSQAIGLMADIDLGTEHLRAMGDTRFILGYIQGVIANKKCPIDIDVKLGTKGSKDKQEMREKVTKFNERGQWSEGSSETNGTSTREELASDMPALRHGVVTDKLEEDGDSLPILSALDPSWPHNILSNSAGSPQPSTNPPAETWVRLSAPVSTLYAGKIPFVSRDLMQFPFALPGDGTVDIALILHDGGRAAKLRAINDAESGTVVYDSAVVYLKVEAYRVTPRLASGDATLKKGGLVSIDGGE